MKPTRIILHHSLTKDSKTVSTGAIRDYHINRCGWTDIGYHFLIEKARNHPEIFAGRMPDVKGVHCSGHNQNTIGICFVGNFDVDEVPVSVWNKGIKLVKYLIRQFDIKEIVGHCELNPLKSCPGKNFNINKFREEVGLNE